MNRSQLKTILNDLEKKMVFVVGPRQVGKTWLSKRIMEHYENSLYLNYDSYDDRRIINEQTWGPNHDCIIFDEIHKMPKWKNYIKGVYDKKQDHQRICVTGSARLDVFRNMGDALTGRFFKHRLLPFSLKELHSIESSISLNDLLEKGGFPEPLLSQNIDDAKRWRQDYLDGLIREDVLEFQNISQMNTMNLLVKLCQQRVGSPLSYASLARDLNTSIVTVKKYLDILEALFIIFRVSPYSRNIARSILKESKLYFYDWAMVNADDSIKYENYLACSLLKHCWAIRDQKGEDVGLHYLRTKDNKEVDFCITKNQKLDVLVEAKYSDTNTSPTLAFFSKKYNIPGYQVIYNLGSKSPQKKENIHIISAKEYTKKLYA